MFSSRFMLFPTFNNKNKFGVKIFFKKNNSFFNIKKTNWNWEFISNIIILYSLFYLKCGGGLGWGGGGCNIFLAFYAISKISRKTNSGNKFVFLEKQFFFI